MARCFNSFCINHIKALTVFIGLSTFSYSSSAQLVLSGNKTAAILASALTGTGITIISPTLTCAGNANATFTSGAISPVGFPNGIVLTTGCAVDTLGEFGVGDASSNFASYGNGTPGDAELDGLTGGDPTFDACILEFNFKPAGDTIKFNYVFGSEEYTDYTCSPYNDVFAFFISGGAYATPTNLALVPGTNIPIAINSVNCGATGGYTIGPCNAMGPGSPFCTYYVNNLTGPASAYITYDGLTTVLQAVAAVSPCDTYHLKLAIADADDDIFDSGVFIEGGSLTSATTTAVHSAGTSGLPYCIRGCAPGDFVFTTPVAQDTNIIVRYVITGSAVNGFDYATIADSAIILAGDTSTILYINTLTVPPTGTKVVTLQIEVPDPCHPGVYTIGATANLSILDPFDFNILTPDTTICLGQAVTITAVRDTAAVFDTILSYMWAPPGSLSSDTALITIATPTITTTYTLSATADSVLGCIPVTHTVTVTVELPAPTVTYNDTICLGYTDSINLTVPDSGYYHYQWAPPTFVSNDTIPNPTITPTVDGTFTWTITIQPSVAVCSITDVLSLYVIPNTFTISPTDTSICKGASVQVFGSPYPLFNYSWSPSAGVPNLYILTPLITPDTSATYVVTATYFRCPVMRDTLRIDVQPNPIAYIGGNRFLCEFDTLHINASVTPTWYEHYAYNWAPSTHLDNDTSSVVVFSGDTTATITFTVSTPAGCFAIDSAQITVYPGNFASLDPNIMKFCPHDTAILSPSGGVAYRWSPSFYLSDSTAIQPVIRPITSQTYTVFATSQYGCRDTLNFTAIVEPAAVIYLGDSVTLYPGESYQITPQTNCTIFAWFPPAGLSGQYIADPIAMPDISTKYVVTGTTEWGCVAKDSINIYVDPQTLLAVPNAFTPGSGPNNEFKIIKLGIATLNYFRIFNRWGNLVFETNDIDAGWDGTYKGVPQPFGVFVYQVEAVTSTGKIFEKHGNLTLIR